MGVYMTLFSWRDEIAPKLFGFGGVLAIINITLFGLGTLATNNLDNSKITPIEFKIEDPGEYDMMEIDERINKNKSKSEKCNILTTFLFPGLTKRIHKAHKNWLIKGDNSVDWYEWAYNNPQLARDICLEVEFFYGCKNTYKNCALPKDWEEENIRLRNEQKEVLKIDDGSYNPRIFEKSNPDLH